MNHPSRLLLIPIFCIWVGHAQSSDWKMQLDRAEARWHNRELKMRMIHVQVQPERAKRLDIAAADESLRRIAKDRTLVRRFKLEEGSDNGSYLNFNYLTTKPADLWQALRSEPLRSRLFRSASMAVCEGANGWDDYLLLHHWDRRLKRDAVPMTSNNAFKRRRAKRARP